MNLMYNLLKVGVGGKITPSLHFPLKRANTNSEILMSSVHLTLSSDKHTTASHNQHQLSLVCIHIKTQAQTLFVTPTTCSAISDCLDFTYNRLYISTLWSLPLLAGVFLFSYEAVNIFTKQVTTQEMAWQGFKTKQKTTKKT